MDRDDLLERAQWDGAAGTSRRRLLEQLQGKSTIYLADGMDWPDDQPTSHPKLCSPLAASQPSWTKPGVINSSPAYTTPIPDHPHSIPTISVLPVLSRQ